MNAKSVVMFSVFLFVQMLNGAGPITAEDIVTFAERGQGVVQQQPAVDPQITQLTAQLAAALAQANNTSRPLCDEGCRGQVNRCAAGASLPVSTPLACVYGFLFGAMRGCWRNHKAIAEDAWRSETCSDRLGEYCLCCLPYSCTGSCSGAAEGAYTMSRKPVAYACSLKTSTRWQEHCIECFLGGRESGREERDRKDCCKLWFCEDEN